VACEKDKGVSIDVMMMMIVVYDTRDRKDYTVLRDVKGVRRRRKNIPGIKKGTRTEKSWMQ